MWALTDYFDLYLKDNNDDDSDDDWIMKNMNVQIYGCA